MRQHNGREMEYSRCYSPQKSGFYWLMWTARIDTPRQQVTEPRLVEYHADVSMLTYVDTGKLETCYVEEARVFIGPLTPDQVLGDPPTCGGWFEKPDDCHFWRLHTGPCS